MRITHKDLKQGTIAVQTQTPDDLWYLTTIVNEGDIVLGSSEYKFKLGGSDAKQKIVKKKVTVELEVEKVELSGNITRISGVVTGGSEDVPRGSHHGIDIEEGSRITIKKERWLDFQLEKLKEACNSGGSGTVLCLFDREFARILRLKPNGVDVLSEIKGDVPKKGVDEEKQHRFYKEIAERLETVEAQQILAASPAFWKQYLEKELSAETKNKTIFTSVSGTDDTAVKELLKSKELQQVLQNERSAREENMLEDVMSALGKDMLVYGKDDVKAVLSEGNCLALYVSENEIVKARAENRYPSLEAIMKTAGDLDAKVRLFSTREPMVKIDGLGGVVVVKRW